MWLRTLLLVLLIFFLVRFVMRLARGVAAGMAGGPAPKASRRAAVKMVADPVCGTYVIPGKALQLTRGRETHYFCSESCREKWERA